MARSESRLRALIKRKGYRYRRPKHDLGHLQEKEAKAKIASVETNVIDDDFELIFVDETTLTLDPPLRAC